MRWLMGALALILAVIAWRLLRRQKEPPPQSFVLLLNQPRAVGVQILAECFSAASGRQVRAIPVQGGDEATAKAAREAAGDFVTGASPHFIANVGGTIYMVHNLAQPYTDPERSSEKMPELRLRKAVREHKAWLSVDILHSQAVSPEAWRIVGRVAANLVGADCLALYHPPLGRWAVCGEDTAERLRAENPIDAVFLEFHAPPVIPIDDDPRLKAAEEEARRRFPEFEAAFRAKNGQAFAIKAPVSGNGNTEHIWVEVDQIADGMIQGRLINDPVDLGELKMGAMVSVEVGHVEDWVVHRGDEMDGNFTTPVVMKLQEERASRDWK